MDEWMDGWMDGWMEYIKELAELGLPSTEKDLHFTMKAYLHKQRYHVTQFKNKLIMPGYNWVKFFMKRHPNLKV
jgi:hypothetical protein